MAPFEELQQLWQQQTVWRTGETDAASLSNDFRRYGRKQDLINLVKMALVAIQFVYLVAKLRNRPVEMFGAALADFSAVYFLIYEWRNQRAIARLNFAARSVDFLRTAIARLRAQRNPFQCREFYVMMGGFWVGCNLMLPLRNWVGHLLITAAPVPIYYLAVYLRGKRWDYQCRPLVERLTAVAEAAEERRA